MQTEAKSQDRDREATSRRFSIGGFSIGVFVVAELLCTGALIAGLVIWM